MSPRGGGGVFVFCGVRATAPCRAQQPPLMSALSELIQSAAGAGSGQKSRSCKDSWSGA